MKRIFYTIILVFVLNVAKSQSLYFPPNTGNTWDTISPQSLGWCQTRIDRLYNYLQAKNSSSFLLLKDGKIVLEKYFGAFTADSVHFWASAGKSLTATLVGIAQENKLLDINNPVSDYLGSGWTSEPIAKEKLITIQHLLMMLSGMDDAPPPPCDNEDSSKACLSYLQDSRKRWAYHTGAYKHLQELVSKTSGLTYNSFTKKYLSSHIGMSGLWFDGVYYSNTRMAARFGLLTLGRGLWNKDTVMHDLNYYAEMVSNSQSYNKAYGYLWWLNGRPTFMAPGSQTVFNGSLFSNAPADMFCALGKYDQKIYIVPSTNMVVVRFGNSAYGTNLAFSKFDNELWDYINKLKCTNNDIAEVHNSNFLIYPNPFTNKINIQNASGNEWCELYNATGQLVWKGKHIEQQDFSDLKIGMYFLKVGNSVTKIIRNY